MVRFGLNLPKDDCQVSYIFVWMNLSVCFTGEFFPKIVLFKDSSCAGVTYQNTQIGIKSGSGCFHTPRFPSLDLESRVELWKLGKPWWRGLKRSHHILVWRRLVRHVNMWWASQFRGALWVWNRERGHGTQKNWALCHWAWLGGANSLKGQVCRCVLRIKEKRLGALWVWNTENTERGHGRWKNWALCHWAWLGGANSLKGQICRCVLKIKEKRLGALWVWNTENTERGHGRRKNWGLCHWAWLGGANSLKGQVCHCVLKIKEKRLGALWVWSTENTERGHGRGKNWALCHWAWLGGANSLKGQVCRCVLRIKEKRLGALWVW
jgi:hypothetical protein